jgi:hypothetical protein
MHAGRRGERQVDFLDLAIEAMASLDFQLFRQAGARFGNRPADFDQFLVTVTGSP